MLQDSFKNKRSCQPITFDYLKIDFFLSVFLYSVILTEYVAIETKGVCMSVCVCIYMCVFLCVEALQPRRLCRFW